MLYEKLNIKQLDLDLKLACIDEFNRQILNTNPFVHYSQIYETVNTNSIAFVLDAESYIKTCGADSATIKFYTISANLENDIKKFYSDHKLGNCGFCFQLVSGSHYMAPHIDPPKHRHDSVSYVLYQGDTPAVTTWYKSKKEYEHLEMSHSVCIPFDKLDPIAEYIAQPDTWYWYDVSVPHSVTNLTGNRMFLQAYNF
jgi:hypothetical protein